MGCDLRAASFGVVQTRRFQTLMGSDSLVFSSASGRAKYRKTQQFCQPGFFRCETVDFAWRSSRPDAERPRGTIVLESRILDASDIRSNGDVIRRKCRVKSLTGSGANRVS